MWQLSVLSSIDGRRDYVLESGKYILGRKEDSDIVILDKAASRTHAEIEFDEGNDYLLIKDLNSSNGTYLNGHLIKGSSVLYHNDAFRIGMHLITVEKMAKTESTFVGSEKIKAILESKPRHKNEIDGSREQTEPTRRLFVESIDNFSILFEDLHTRLIPLVNIDEVLYETEQFLIRLTDSDGCKIVLQNEFDRFEELEIPIVHANKVISQSITSLIIDLHETKEEITGNYQSLILVPIFKSSEVKGILFLYKTRPHVKQLDKRDLQFSIAAGHQVELAIQRNDFKQQLIHNAMHDELTSLPNRNLLIDKLNRKISNYSNKAGPLYGLFFIDIDNFKTVNDSLGHIYGDKILSAFGERLSQAFENAEVIARYGGDEFIILCEGIKDKPDSLHIAESLIAKLQKPFVINSKEMFLSVSIGIALSAIEYKTATDMIRDADIAMYQAKDNPDAKIKIFDNAMQSQVTELMHMQNDLRRGAIQEEFYLYYQPIVNITNNKIVGFEALIRWHSPELGVVMPNDFLGVVNSTGLLDSFDIWSLHNACDQLSIWINDFPDKSDLFVSINISPKLLNNTYLTKEIELALTTNNLSPSNLRLEITERTRVGSDKFSLDLLSNLKDMGIVVGLDDFGTGYNALSYLHRLPISFLKIDKSFIQDFGKTEDANKIVKLILSLAENLDLSVIAEGVENKNQLNLLQKAGCQYVQGFLFSKPVESKHVAKILKKDSLI